MDARAQLKKDINEVVDRIIDRVMGQAGQAQQSQQNQGFVSFCSDKKCAAIIDTGSNIIAGPSKALRDFARLARVEQDCSNLDQLPNLNFTLGDATTGVHVSLPPKAYVMQVSLPEGAGGDDGGEEIASRSARASMLQRALRHAAGGRQDPESAPGQEDDGLEDDEHADTAEDPDGDGGDPGSGGDPDDEADEAEEGDAADPKEDEAPNDESRLASDEEGQEDDDAAQDDDEAEDESDAEDDDVGASAVQKAEKVKLFAAENAAAGSLGPRLMRLEATGQARAPPQGERMMKARGKAKAKGKGKGKGKAKAKAKAKAKGKRKAKGKGGATKNALFAQKQKKDSKDARRAAKSSPFTWHSAIHHLRKHHGVDLLSSLHDGIDLKRIRRDRKLCMPALVALDKHTPVGELWVVGSPLFEEFYTRWSWAKDAENPSLHLSALKTSKTCAGALGSKAGTGAADVEGAGAAAAAGGAGAGADGSAARASVDATGASEAGGAGVDGAGGSDGSASGYEGGDANGDDGALGGGDDADGAQVGGDGDGGDGGAVSDGFGGLLRREARAHHHGQQHRRAAAREGALSDIAHKHTTTTKVRQMSIFDIRYPTWAQHVDFV